jgi:hypothetical protein
MSDPAEFGIVAGTGFFSYDSGSDRIVYQNGMRVESVEYALVSPGIRACQVTFDETLRQTGAVSLALGACEIVSSDPGLDLWARLWIPPTPPPDARLRLNLVLRNGASTILDWSALGIPGGFAGVSFVVMTGGTGVGQSA